MTTTNLFIYLCKFCGFKQKSQSIKGTICKRCGRHLNHKCIIGQIGMFDRLWQNKKDGSKIKEEDLDFITYKMR